MTAHKHSGLALASFIMSVVSGLGMLVLFAIAGVMEAAAPGGIDEKSLGAAAVGMLFIGALFASIAALGLGIGGLLQKERKKIFAILGTVFSATTAIGTAVLMIID